MKKSQLLIAALTLLSLVGFGQNDVSEKENSAFRLPITLEAGGIYEYGLKESLVNSNGYGTRLTCIYDSKGKLDFGLAVDWRLIPGIISRRVHEDFKSQIYPALNAYNGPDSLPMNQLRNVFDNKSSLDFGGYMKIGISLMISYEINPRNRFRLNAGILYKSFETLGNDALSNPYKEPGHYWLTTGQGYSLRVEERHRLGCVGKYTMGVIVGAGYQVFNYNNLSYNDVPLISTLGIQLGTSDRSIENYNLYLGLCLYRER